MKIVFLVHDIIGNIFLLEAGPEKYCDSFLLYFTVIYPYYHWKWTSRFLCSMKFRICCWVRAVMLLQDQQCRDRRLGGIFRRSRHSSGPILIKNYLECLIPTIHSPMALVESDRLQGGKWVVTEDLIEQFVWETAHKLEIDTPGTE